MSKVEQIKEAISSKKDVGSTAKMLDELYADHEKAAKSTTAKQSKGKSTATPEEIKAKAQATGIHQVDAALHDGKTLPKITNPKDANNVHFRGTYKGADGTAKYLVFSDNNTDPNKHHVYMMGDGGQTIEVKVDKAKTGDERFSAKDPKVKLDGSTKGNTETADPRKPGLEGPGVHTENVLGKPMVTDVRDTTGKKHWHRDFKLDENNNLQVTRVSFTEDNASGGYTRRVFTPLFNSANKQEGEWLCSTYTKENKGAQEVRSGSDNSSRYWVSFDSSSMAFTKRDTNGTVLENHSYGQDGIHIAKTNTGKAEVTEKYSANPIAGIVAGDRLPVEVTVPESKNADAGYGSATTYTSPVTYRLTHKSGDGRQVPIGLYTKVDDKSNPPMTFIWKGGKMHQWIDYSDPVVLDKQ